MMLHPRVLLVEFNELAPALIDRFLVAGDLPNFKRLRDRSSCYVTDASDERTLEPWTQWPTLHSGIPDAVHGIEHLGQSDRVAGRGIAAELTAAGFRVGLFSPMNIDCAAVNGGFFVPDPWAQGHCQPDSLHGYYDFVARAVQENSSNGLRRDLIPRFGAFLLRNGLRPRTVGTVVRHLLAEGRTPALAWRRAMVLDQLNYDVFRHLTRKHQVDFATFFSNTTAHYQHYYWRNLEPEAFSIPPPQTEDPSLSKAVRAGYQNMDRLIGRMLDDFGEWRIVLATGLSQQMWDSDKSMWRPHRPESLLELVGIATAEVSVEPVMAEEFLVRFTSDAAAAEGHQRLKTLVAAGESMLRMQRQDNLVKAGCAINAAHVEHDLVVAGPEGRRPFHELFYRIHGLRSGRHHPDGVLWIESDKPEPDAGRIPLTAVAPSILSLFGLHRPGYMEAEAVSVT